MISNMEQVNFCVLIMDILGGDGAVAKCAQANVKTHLKLSHMVTIHFLTFIRFKTVVELFHTEF